MFLDATTQGSSPRTADSNKKSRPRPERRRRSAAVRSLVTEYKRRRGADHQANCFCQSRGGELGCIELRAQLLEAGEWRVVFEVAK